MIDISTFVRVVVVDGILVGILAVLLQYGWMLGGVALLFAIVWQLMSFRR